MVLQKRGSECFDTLNFDPFFDPKSKKKEEEKKKIFAVFFRFAYKTWPKKLKPQRTVKNVFEESHEDGLYKHIGSD